MDVTRREFLRLAGASTVGAVLFAGCTIPTRELLIQSPGQMPEEMVTGFNDWYASLCRHCSGTEGIIVRVMEGRAKKIEGNPDFPVNQGKSSARCQAALQALYHPDRIQGPLRRQGDTFVSISRQEAMDELVAKLGEQRTSPQRVLLLTEPLRGHLGKLSRLFAERYGARHMAYEALEETVVRAAVREVFGQERLPDLDIAHTRTLLSFGADFLGTWLSPVRFARGYGEFRQGEGRSRGYFVQVEPRMSMTAANADEWVPVKPGTEGLLALSMAQVIVAEGLAKSPQAVQALTGGRGVAALEAFTPEQVASQIGVGAEAIRELARRFATQTPSLAIGGGSAAAHTNGLYNLKAIYSLNYLVDSVGKPGGLIFNPPFPLEDVPSTAAGASCQQWKDLRAELARGQVGLVLVRGTNPVHGLAAMDFGGALQSAGYVISFSSYMDETTALADLVLPEPTPLEDWGDDVPDPGPGYATLGIQQPVVKPLFDTQGFGDVLLDAARRLEMGQGLPASFQEMLQEGARRLYDGGQHGMVRASTFEDFWRGLLMRGGWWDVRATAQAAPMTPPPLPRSVLLPDFAGKDLPYHLLPFPSVGLTDGRGANLLWLQATPDPLTTVVWKSWVEVNPRTAEKLGLREGDVVALEAEGGRRLEAPVYPHPAAPPDVLSVPMGQGHSSYGRWAEGRGANVLSLVGERTEAETKALAWAATKVRLLPTGQRVRISKVEGTVLPLELPGMDIVQVTRE